MEVNGSEPCTENKTITLEDLPDQPTMGKIRRNNSAPSTKTAELQTESMEKLMSLDVSKLTKPQSQEWLVFARSNLVEKAITEAQSKAELDQLKGTVESLMSETRETNGIKQISDFSQKVLGKMISPPFIRPILFQGGFAAIDVSSAAMSG